MLSANIFNLIQVPKPVTDSSSDVFTSEKKTAPSPSHSKPIRKEETGTGTGTKKRTASKPSQPSRSLMRSSMDRFDLRGSKVINRDCCVEHIAVALEENSLFKGWNLADSDSLTHSIAVRVVDTMLSVDFAVEHTPLDGKQE